MVLLSQRRRWINSTIHNLMELLFVHDLCGTFCFSMQFVVFMELVGTLALPAAISFTLYLIVMAILGQPALIPLILLALILGLPAVLIVMTSRKVVYVGWMLIYLVSIPIWNFVLPTYAYWHFDDFSWGDTRKVEGVKADKKGGHADKEGEFDSSVITMKKWSEYEKDRRVKEAMERNLPIPRFVNKTRSGMDVFRDSVFVKRTKKPGSSGSNESDVPLTQKSYAPAGSSSVMPLIDNHVTHESNVENLIVGEDRRPKDLSPSYSDDSSVGPEIPLTTLNNSDIPPRPRAPYNAGLAELGLEYDDDYSNNSYNSQPIYQSTLDSVWANPAPHHRHPIGYSDDDPEDDSPYQAKSTVIPIPPPHDFSSDK